MAMKKLICSAVIASMFIMSAVPVFAYDLPENTIAVSGRGIVSVEPDTAQISLAVVTSNSDAEMCIRDRLYVKTPPMPI